MGEEGRLTDRQRAVYEFIRAYIQRCGYGPKLREIAQHLGIRSRGTVHRYVRAVVDAGLIEIRRDRARGIHLRAPDLVQGVLPLLGRIAAGRPIEAIPGEEQLSLHASLAAPHRYALCVQGDSMIEAGILDGDFVIVDAHARARDGDIVVALIDTREATLKRLQRHRDGSIGLHPANAALTSMRYPAERVQLQGVVVGQLRVYPR